MLWNGHVVHCCLGILPELLSSLAGMAAGTDDEIKCSPSPRAGSSITPSPGRLSNERAGIARAKETRRSGLLLTISALEAALWGCTAAPCSRAGQGRC